jgi:hypothetical protein
VRAPGRSFTDALATFRKTIVEGPNDAHRALILKILDNWQAHGHAEKAWNDLIEASARAANPMPPAGFFIGWVIRTRFEAEKLARMTREAPAVASRVSAQADRDFKKGGSDRIAKPVENKTATTAFAEQADAVLGRKKMTRRVRDSFACGAIPSCTTAASRCMTWWLCWQKSPSTSGSPATPCERW